MRASGFALWWGRKGVVKFGIAPGEIASNMQALQGFGNKRRTWTLMLLATTPLVAGTFMAGGCGGKTSAGGPAGGGPMAMPVQVEVAQSIRIPETTEYLSVLKSRQSAMINPQVEGQVTKIFREVWGRRHHGHAAAANRSAEAESHGERPGSISSGATGNGPTREG